MLLNATIDDFSAVHTYQAFDQNIQPPYTRWMLCTQFIKPLQHLFMFSMSIFIDCVFVCVAWVWLNRMQVKENLQPKC